MSGIGHAVGMSVALCANQGSFSASPVRESGMGRLCGRQGGRPGVAPYTAGVSVSLPHEARTPHADPPGGLLEARARTVSAVGGVVGRLLARESWARIAGESLTLTFAALQRAWDVATHATGDADLGFRVAAAFAWGQRGLSDQLLLAAPTLRQALEGQAQWGRLTGEFVRHIAREDGELVWIHVAAPAQTRQHRASQDLYVARLVSGVQHARRSPESARAVRFKYPRPESLATHRRVLGERCLLHFDSSVLEVAFPLSWYDASLPGRDRARFVELEHEARLALSRLTSTEDQAELVGRVADAARDSLERPGPSLDAVAERLGMSERSVRRKLETAGVGWRDLLDELRLTSLELSSTAGRMRRADAAKMLGFANEGALRRAARRWSQRLPRERASASRGTQRTL